MKIKLLCSVHIVVFSLLLLLSCDVKIQDVEPIVIDPSIHRITSGWQQCSSPAWSPDGSRIAFTQTDIYSDLYYYDATTGRQLGLFASIPDDFSGRISLSPDYQTIVYRSSYQGNLWLYSLLDETVTRLTEKDSLAFDPVFSADGNTIYYICPDEDRNYCLKSININGGDPSTVFSKERIIGDPCPISSLTVSPDNRHIAFASFNHDSSHYEIVVLDLKSGEITSVISDDYENRNPDWSPDGKSIAFLSENNSFPILRIYDVRSEEINVLPLKFYGPQSVRWSPDGSKLAVVNSDETLVYDIKTEAETIIDINDISPPIWLPDGQSLIVRKRNTELRSLYVTNLNDLSDYKLTHPTRGYSDHYPNWSPDGKSIYFYRSNSEMIKIDAEGGALNQICKQSWYNPELSKDGSKFIYYYGYRIYTRRLVDAKSHILKDYLSHRYFEPCWGPDTTQFACCSDDSLLLFKIEKDSVIKQGGLKGYFRQPRWSVQHPVFGSRIAVVCYSDRYSSNPDIYIVEPKSLEMKKCISDGQYPNWSPDGTQLVYANRSGGLYVKKILYEF